MSCDATVVATFDTDADANSRGDEIASVAVTRLHELEQRWSRFLPCSEVSHLNAHPSAVRQVSADTFVLVERLVQAWRATDGAFDPTLVGAIVHLGYGVSRERSDRRTSLPADTGRRGRPGGILVRPSDRSVLLGAGTAIDPGGLGKGLAADLVTAEMMAAGAAGALVEIGGDVRVRGRSPSHPGWPITIEGRDRIAIVADGGIATSTTSLRFWSCEGTVRHHLVDPGTLRSSDVDVETCTVIADTGAWADALTKIAFARGPLPALTEYERIGVAASIITNDGRVVETSTWKEFVR